ncbi:MAG: hypothetical protein ACI8Y4_001260 [Candidatus Poriferisodalaceae bacterium]|jgi:hypothetical protein
MKIRSAAAALAVFLSACSGSDSRAEPPVTTADLTQVVATSEAPAVPLTVTVPVVSPSRGGVVRVGMWIEPDPTATHSGGEIVRSLVQPQLFLPRPDGGWAPGLVEPGSVTEANDLTSVSFRLRAGAVWSDGVPISGDDLAATADERFVAEVVSLADGQITLNFTQPLPGWRRLWSGRDALVPQRDGVYGGAFVVVSVTPGLVTVLEPNETWWGAGLDEFGGGPWIDELHLVVVPDQTTMMQLFDRGELDVVAPWASPGRLVVLEDIAGERIDVADEGGWSVIALVNPNRLEDDERRSLLTGLEAGEVVASLLKGEASAGSLTTNSGALFEPRDPADLDLIPTITLAEDVPTLGFAARAMQLKADDAGGLVPELRQAPTRLVEQWQAEGDYMALLTPAYSGPSGCFVCLYGDVAPGEAALADAGDFGPLDEALIEHALALTLWNPKRVVAWRETIRGVEANGYAYFATWNAWQWWVAS